MRKEHNASPFHVIKGGIEDDTERVSKQQYIKEMIENAKRTPQQSLNKIYGEIITNAIFDEDETFDLDHASAYASGIVEGLILCGIDVDPDEEKEVFARLVNLNIAKKRQMKLTFLEQKYDEEKAKYEAAKAEMDKVLEGMNPEVRAVAEYIINKYDDEKLPEEMQLDNGEIKKVILSAGCREEGAKIRTEEIESILSELIKTSLKMEKVTIGRGRFTEYLHEVSLFDSFFIETSKEEGFMFSILLTEYFADYIMFGRYVAQKR